MSASVDRSVGPIAGATPTRRDETRLRGSGEERDTACVSNARVGTSQSLAYLTPCRYCDGPIFMALCRDGRWRSFDTQTVPAAPFGVWAWRKTHGMEEQELVAGKRKHYCASYSKPDLAPWDRGGRA